LQRREPHEVSSRPGKTGLEITQMIVIDSNFLLLVPATFSLSFLLWVFWNLLKDERRQRH
jgi:hypothetical protein